MSHAALDAERTFLKLVPNDAPAAAVAQLDARIGDGTSVKRHDGFMAPDLTLYRYTMEGGYEIAIHIPTMLCRGDVPSHIGKLAAAAAAELAIQLAASGLG